MAKGTGKQSGGPGAGRSARSRPATPAATFQEKGDGSFEVKGGAPAPTSPPPEKARALTTDAEHSKFGEAYEKPVQSLTKGEMKAVQEYSALYYQTVNQYNRGSSNVTPKGREIAKALNGPLDSALAKGRTPEAVTVHRGVRSDHPIAKAVRAGKLGVGTTIGEASHVSTSLDIKQAQRFAGKKGGVIINVAVPKGSQGLYLDARGKRGKSVTAARGEKELLLPRNTNYRVTGIRKVDGQTVVDVEML